MMRYWVQPRDQLFVKDYGGYICKSFVFCEEYG